jgi:DNA-binding LacI/PurR family transcriptional regulator
MRTTRADVAKKAGVSVATVSYVLNNTCPVKDETRAKVLAAVRILNYIPDMRARSMATNRTMQLAVIVSNLTDPIYGEITDHFIQRAAQNGYFVNVSTRIGSIQQNIRNVISQHVDGVFILSVPDELEADMIYNLTETEIRAVIGAPLFDESHKRQVCSIDMAQDEAFRKAVIFLSGMGHHHIAYFGNPKSDPAERRMIPVYKEISRRVKNTNISFFVSETEPKNDYDTGYTLGGGLASEKNRPFSAIVTANDVMANGCVNGLADQGLRVPDCISCMSIKSSGMLPLSSGLPITSIAIDYREFAEMAFDILQNFIDGNMISHYRMSCAFREGKTVRKIGR